MANHNSGFNDQVKKVIAEGEALGFRCDRTRGGHLRFRRPRTPTVFFSATPSDSRAHKNVICQLRRAAALA